MAVQGIFEWMEAGGGTNLCKKEKTERFISCVIFNRIKNLSHEEFCIQNKFSMCAGNRIIHTTGSLEPAHVMLAVEPGEPYG